MVLHSRPVKKLFISNRLRRRKKKKTVKKRKGRGEASADCRENIVPASQGQKGAILAQMAVLEAQMKQLAADDDEERSQILADLQSNKRQKL